MVGRSIAATLAGGKALTRLLALSLLAGFIASFVAWGEAHACPPGAKPHHASPQNKLRSIDVAGKQTLTAAEAPAFALTPSLRGGCGGTSPAADPCGKSGCCSADAAIAGLKDNGLADVHLPASYNAPLQDHLTSAQRAPHFRPPQIAV
jgi:hypothetical protein